MYAGSRVRNKKKPPNIMFNEKKAPFLQSPLFSLPRKNDNSLSISRSLSAPFSMCLIFQFSPPFSLPFVIQVKEFWSFTWINLQLVLQAETLARRYSSEQFVQFVGKTSNFASSHQVHLTFEPYAERLIKILRVRVKDFDLWKWRVPLKSKHWSRHGSLFPSRLFLAFLSNSYL